MPAVSALRAYLIHPSMSGRAAGEVDLVVATLDVSWTVFMATSPPLGIIQWNLRFMGLCGFAAANIKSGCRFNLRKNLHQNARSNDTRFEVLAPSPLGRGLGRGLACIMLRTLP